MWSTTLVLLTMFNISLQECRETPLDESNKLYVYRKSFIMKETVYLCFYYEEMKKENPFQVVPYNYSDTTENCLSAFITSTDNQHHFYSPRTTYNYTVEINTTIRQEKEIRVNYTRNVWTTLREYTTTANLMSDTIEMPHGHSCTYSHYNCTASDNSSLTYVWRPKKSIDNKLHCEDFIPISTETFAQSNISIDEKQFLILKGNKTSYALELMSETERCHRSQETTDHNLVVTKRPMYGVKTKTDLHGENEDIRGYLGEKEASAYKELVRECSNSQIHGNNTSVTEGTFTIMSLTFTENVLSADDRLKRLLFYADIMLYVCCGFLAYVALMISTSLYNFAMNCWTLRGQNVSVAASLFQYQINRFYFEKLEAKNVDDNIYVYATVK